MSSIASRSSSASERAGEASSTRITSSRPAVCSITLPASRTASAAFPRTGTTTETRSSPPKIGSSASAPSASSPSPSGTTRTGSAGEPAESG